MKKKIASTFLVGMIALPTVSFGHGVEEQADLDILNAPEILSDAQELIDADLVPEQSVVDQFKVWEVGQTLKACFFSGGLAAKEFFVETAAIWDNATSINFDFGTKPNYYECGSGGEFHIRVSLAASGGNWSYIGTDSVKVAQTKPSLNINLVEPFSLNPSLRRLAGTILHELGHAIALKHEHQSPESNCELEIDWDTLYEELAQPPNEWDTAKVDHNLRRLVDSPRLRISEYDPKSIMHYSLPPRWFKDGIDATCYIKKNNSLSDLDKVAAKETYPALPQKQDDYLNSLHSNLAVRLEESKASSETIAVLSGLINGVNSLVPEREVHTDLQATVTLIGSAVTKGNCSPIITDAGNVSITCN